MKAWGNDTVRGGQTVFHGLRMWSQLVTVGVMTIAILVVTVPVFMLWRTTPTYDGYAAGMLTLAETKLSIGYDADAGQEVRLENGDTVVTTIADIAAFGPWHAARDGILETVISGAWLGAKIGAGLVALMLCWFRYQGYRLKQKKRLRGAELVSARELSRRVHPLKVRALHRLAGAPAPYRIAGVPYPERTETQHTIVSGTTGSGKTVLISDLVQQIRQRGDRCVIYDKMGSYTQAFFDPERDVLLNPLDARAPRWSPFFEARSPRDFDTMAAALIPQQKDTVDPFWVTAARQLFSNGAGVLWEKGVKQNAVLVEHLLKTDLTELAKAMEGTVAQSIVDPENPKTALSVRAMLTANIGAMEILPDAGKPFSIREWTSRNEENSFLFLTSRGDQHATLRGLISTWLEIAVNALLSLDRDDDRRIWVILDELPTLHQVPSLQPGLAESRQFGGCFVLGVQVASALAGSLRAKRRRNHLRALRHASRVRRTGPGHRAVVGRQPGAKRDRGSRRGRELRRRSRTATASRSRRKRELQSLALPSEITRLPNLTGYLKLPGPLPVARIELDYVKRPKNAPRFVPRTHAHGTLPDASASESPDPNADVQDALAPQSPEPNGDTRDVLVLVSPDAKPEEQVEPEPVNVTTNGTTDSAVAASAQGEFAFHGEDTGNGAGDEKPVASGAGKIDAPGADEAGPAARPAGRRRSRGCRERGTRARKRKRPGRGQSNGRPKPAWTPI